jgi:Domain of unknown function (DUF4340)
MKPRAIAELGIVALVAVVVAAATYVSQNPWSQAKVTGAALFPGLASQSAKIARIELRQGDKKLALERKDQAWVLADRGGYPAKAEPVRTLLVRLAEAQLVEPKTRKSDRFALLELEDAGAKDTKSREVRLLDQQGTLIAQAIIGKKRTDAFGSSKPGTYVRWPEDQQAWLANTDVDVSATVRDWVQPTLLDVEAAKITAVTVEIPNEAPLQIEREAGDAGKHKLVALPQGKKLKQGADIDAVVRAVGALEFEDVRKADPAASGEVSTARLQADGGLAVTLRLRKDADDTWVSLTASGDGDAKKTADDITNRSQGWEFKIAPAKATAILKRPADLFEAS